jgi:hypothetical protein
MDGDGGRDFDRLFAPLQLSLEKRPRGFDGLVPGELVRAGKQTNDGHCYAGDLQPAFQGT